nr:hypothetical protein [Methanobrevibacter arboriphilus]
MTKTIGQITDKINEIATEHKYSDVKFVDAKLKLLDSCGNTIRINLKDFFEE